MAGAQAVRREEGHLDLEHDRVRDNAVLRKFHLKGEC